MNHEELTMGLKQLKLPSMARDYVEVAKLAENEKATYETYLGKMVTGELAEKHAAKVKRLLKEAQLILPKTIDTYDFKVRTGITAKQIRRLQEGHFVREAANIVFYGSFGLGKTHLALSLTQALCEIGFRCYFSSTHRLIDDLLKAKHNLELASLFKRLDRFDLIVCDELGYSPHEQAGADLFFQLISQRSERKSMLFTTNLTYSEWDKVFINPMSTAAAVDRIIHNCETFNIGGPSWRSEEAAKRQKAALTKNVTDAIQ
jgi:DNA replication protein DnaC